VVTWVLLLAVRSTDNKAYAPLVEGKVCVEGGGGRDGVD